MLATSGRTIHRFTVHSADDNDCAPTDASTAQAVLFLALADTNVSRTCIAAAEEMAKSRSLLANATTSDDIPTLRAMLATREGLSRPAAKYHKETYTYSAGFGAFYHEPICRSRVADVLWRMMFPRQNREGGGHQSVMTTYVHVGTLQLPWTFEDVAFARLVNPNSRFIIMGARSPLQLMHTQQQLFKYHCKQKQKLTCQEATLDILDSESFIFIDCSS